MNNTFVLAFLFLLHFSPGGTYETYCSSGERLHTPREGHDVCIPCQYRSFIEDDHHFFRNCKPCKVIENSDVEVLVSACNITHDTVILCTDGFYRRKAENIIQEDKCQKCTECPFPARPCEGYYDTLCCQPNHHAVMTPDGVFVCKERPIVCGAGQFFSTSRQKCLPCPAWTFMSDHSHTYKDCLTCKELSENNLTQAVITRPCSRTAPTLFGCKAGYFRDPTQESLQIEVPCIPCRICNRSLVDCDMFHDAVCDDEDRTGLTEDTKNRARGASVPTGTLHSHERYESKRSQNGVTGWQTSVPSGVSAYVALFVTLIGILIAAFVAFVCTDKPDTEPSPNNVTKGQSDSEPSPNNVPKGQSDTKPSPNNVPKGQSDTEPSPNNVHKGQSDTKPSSNNLPKGQSDTEPSPNNVPKGQSDTEPSPNNVPKSQSDTKPSSNNVPKGQSDSEPSPNNVPKGQSDSEPSPNNVPKGQSDTKPSPNNVPKGQSDTEPSPNNVPKDQSDTEPSPSSSACSRLKTPRIVIAAVLFVLLFVFLIICTLFKTGTIDVSHDASDTCVVIAVLAAGGYVIAVIFLLDRIKNTGKKQSQKKQDTEEKQSQEKQDKEEKLTQAKQDKEENQSQTSPDKEEKQSQKSQDIEEMRHGTAVNGKTKDINRQQTDKLLQQQRGNVVISLE